MGIFEYPNIFYISKYIIFYYIDLDLDLFYIRIFVCTNYFPRLWLGVSNEQAPNCFQFPSFRQRVKAVEVMFP